MIVSIILPTGSHPLFVSVQTQDQHCDRLSRLGSVNFLVGVMGLPNAQRTLDLLPSSYLSPSIIQAVFSICQWRVGLFYLRNWLITFYLLEHHMIRNITGYGEGRAIHNGFLGRQLGRISCNILTKLYFKIASHSVAILNQALAFGPAGM
ncbi:hypothetical protein P692DRAFT_201069856 [Suillus brevipes Sb2]|nr:hypothetical protein P692DRAFT_201069856 [Suillus brevipes Sb2]